MPDIQAAHQENDHLGDVCGMVPHAFQVFCDEDQLERTRNGASVLQHVRQQFAKNLLVKMVEYTVVLNDLCSKIRIRIDERIETLAQDSLRTLCHNGHVERPL